MDYKRWETMDDAYRALRIEAKKAWYELSEVWVEWVRLCYCCLKYTSDDDINKERQRRLEEKEWMKIVYEWVLKKDANRNRTSKLWKINLCKTNIWDYKSRVWELWKKEAYELGRPTRDIKEALQSINK